MVSAGVVWSFFTGAGGLDLGLESAGLHPNLAVEIHPIFCQTLKSNRPNLKVLQRDVSSLSAEELRQLSGTKKGTFLMVGGPPCQPFSSGGLRAGLNDPRGNLIYEYMRLIGEIRPEYFVFENVANIVTAALRHRPISERPGRHWSLKRYDRQEFNISETARPLDPDELSGSAIRQLLRDFDELGYRVRFGVLDAADYGAPQHRLRFVMFGGRDQPPPPLPQPTHGDGQGLLPYATVRDAVHDLQSHPGDHSEYTPDVKAFFELIPIGGNWRALPPELQRAAMGGSFESGGGKTGFFRRLNWDSPAPTITGRSNRKGSAACHPEETRPISVRESARLQGFPDDWRFAGSMSNQYLQIGNAVPVHLGAAIGRSFTEFQAKAYRSKAVDTDSTSLLEAAVARLRASARNRRAPKMQRTLFEDE